VATTDGWEDNGEVKVTDAGTIVPASDNSIAWQDFDVTHATFVATY